MLSETLDRAYEMERAHGNAVFSLRYARKKRTWTAIFSAKRGEAFGVYRAQYKVRPFFYKGTDADKERAILKAMQAFSRVARAEAEKREAEAKAKEAAEKEESPDTEVSVEVAS